MIKDANNFTGTGRLTKDIELIQNGDKVVGRFTLAGNHHFKEDAPNFIPCVIFDKYAEAMKPYLTKGKRVLVIGKVEAPAGIPDEDGSYKNYWNINVDEIIFIDGKKEASNQKDAS